ncbi:MAG: HNH endonuclease [Sediminibacterium sp.]
MSLLLVPATKENLEKSINTPVNISFAKKYLPEDFINGVLKYSGIEGMRCWALTENRKSIFNNIENGDEVLLTQKGTGLFTHYAIVVGKIHNSEFGKALWPIVKKDPWEYIYFLANVTNVKIDKVKLVTDLGYAKNFTVSGIIKVDNRTYQNFGTISQLFKIPVFDNVAETNGEKDFLGKDILATSKRRVGHNKFSKQVKENYNYSCAICNITEVEFLIAAHISPWAEDRENRLNPQNGICLCALHDRAFEHGYISLTNDFRIIINPRINRNAALYEKLKEVENKSIRLPIVDWPNIEFLSNHRKKHSFLQNGY